MKRRTPSIVALGLVVAACTPRPEAETAPEPGPRFPALSTLPVPVGGLGEPDDRVVEWGPHGQWLAVCRMKGDDEQPHLVISPSHELAFDRLEAGDEGGRHVLLTRNGMRLVYDLEKSRAMEVGRVAETSIGDLHEGRLAYVRHTDPPQIVLHELDGGAERTLPSPLPAVHRVEFDRSGEGIWLTTYDVQTEGERSYLDDSRESYIRGDLCDSVLCNAFAEVPRVHVGLLWLDGSFVDLDEAPPRFRGLDGAAVLEDEEGVELVHPDRRQRVAGPGCRVETEHYDPHALLIRCEEDGTERFSMWRDGALTRLDFTGPGAGSESSVHAISGAGSRWLELGELRTVQGVQHQQWAYAYGDHVLLVGDDVEIRDARTDTRVAHLEQRFLPGLTHGPYVGLNHHEPEKPGGVVLDVRTGAPVASYAAEPLALSSGGRVALRDDHGRVQWSH